jgi:hypothetical protein
LASAHSISNVSLTQARLDSRPNRIHQDLPRPGIEQVSSAGFSLQLLERRKSGHIANTIIYTQLPTEQYSQGICQL